MKSMKRACSFLLTLLLLISLLAGCQDSTPDTTGSSELEYRVSLKDDMGEPVASGAIVAFYQEGVQVAMQVCDENGVAAKTLPSGNYTVQPQFTTGENNYYYPENNLALTPENTSLNITLYPKANGEATDLIIPHTEIDEDGWPVTTFDPERDTKHAYHLGEGGTYVTLTPGERTYFLFVPTRGGIYEIYVESGSGCTVGYYGVPNYIRDVPAQDIVDGVTNVSVENAAVSTDSDNTTRLVLGVDSEELTGCIVRIRRLGDPAWNVSQEPWTIYERTCELTQCTLAEDITLKNFDVTKEYEIVYNAKDGYYHVGSADGPVVYAYLTKSAGYVDSFQTILNEGSVRAYFYDADGNFIKKEAYGTCLKEYFPYADKQQGVYPLTQDLKYIIQSYGNYQGWWNNDSPNFLLNVDGLNAESAWLSLCCYFE